MRQSSVEYRTTKEILDGIVRKAAKYSTFEYKTIFADEKMFCCVKPNDSDKIYEVRITKKKSAPEARIVPDDNSKSTDANKQKYFESLKGILECVFKHVNFHGGNILVADDNNDYIISIVKKMNLVWG